MQAPPSDPSSPEPLVFRLPMTVADDDIDLLGHASNIAYVRWVQDVAIAHSEAVGLGVDRYRELGGVFVVRRHEVDYLRPVLRGERLELRTWIGSVSAAKCLRVTEIVRVHDSSSDETIVARASTTWGFIEFASGRPARIPNGIREAFGQATLRSRE